ncbi:MAG: hypothetical protein QM704_04870 [Anaeromyxobacteraceae bacterium]
MRAPEVARAGAVPRQGEWFFPPATSAELAALEEALRAKRTVVQRGVPVGPGRNPHVADERVEVPATPAVPPEADVPGRSAAPAFVLVRGRVRHVDHDTVRLSAWCKVVRNAEAVERDGLAWVDGVRWVD